MFSLLVLLGFFDIMTSAAPLAVYDPSVREKELSKLFTKYTNILSQFMDSRRSWYRSFINLFWGQEKIDFLYASLNTIRIDPNEDIPTQINEIILNLKFSISEPIQSTFSYCSGCIEGIATNNILVTLLWISLITLFFYCYPYIIMFSKLTARCSRRLMIEARDMTFYRTPRREIELPTPTPRIVELPTPTYPIDNPGIIELPTKVPHSSTPQRPIPRRALRKSPNTILREQLTS